MKECVEGICSERYWDSFLFSCCVSVEKVRSQWDSTQNGVEARLLQLDHMIGHSDQWEEQRRNVKALIGQNEMRLHNLLQQSREPLTKQISDNKVRTWPFTFDLYYLWLWPFTQQEVKLLS